MLDCIFVSTWDPVLDRGVEMCKANVNREDVKISTPSHTYRLDCPIRVMSTKAYNLALGCLLPRDFGNSHSRP